MVLETSLDSQRQWAEQIEAQATRFRILSTLPFTKVAFWVRAVDTLSFPGRQGWSSRYGISSAVFVMKLLARANRYDLVLLTGGERRDLIYAAVAGLCFWIRTPHVIVDAHWQRAVGWQHVLQKLLLRLSRRLVRQVQPHSAEEVQIYHKIFGLPLATLRPVPWSTSLIGYDENSPSEASAEAPFVLTGGISFRDYRTFLAGAKLSGVRIKIGLPRAGVTPEIQEWVSQCPNVTLHTTWSNADYIRQIQLCRVFAMPIIPALTRSTADQTILNAMHFGKVMVSTDSIGPRIYIRDGENGFLISEQSPAAWANVLLRVFSLSAAEYDRIGQQAKHDARIKFNEPFRLARTLAMALDVVLPQSPETTTH